MVQVQLNNMSINIGANYGTKKKWFVCVKSRASTKSCILSTECT